MAPLDHTSFPHIIDAVWANMDFETILVARQTCTEWRRRGNKRLYRHVLLEPLNPPSRFRRFVPFSPPDCMLLSTKLPKALRSEGLKLPRLRISRPDLAHGNIMRGLSAPQTDPLRRILNDAEVIDLMCTLELFRADIDCSRLLRTIEKGVVLRANLSQFTPYDVPDNIKGQCIMCRGLTQVYFVHLLAPVTVIATLPRTIVLNIDLQEDGWPFGGDMYLLQVIVPRDRTTSTQLVLVLRGGLWLDRLEERVTRLWRWIPPDCPIVDLTIVIPVNIDTRARAFTQFESLVHYHFSSTKEATTIKSTRILTPDMYRAEVGEEKYELYTEW